MGAQQLFGVEVIHGLRDAMTDLVANGVGALVAAILATKTNRRPGREDKGRPA